MYKAVIYAYTLVMIFALISLFLIFLTIPMQLNLNGFLSIKEKKLYFSLGIFNFICASGYINFTNKKMIIWLKKNKNKTVEYINLLPNKAKTDFVKHFDAVTFHSAILFGGEFDDFKAYSCILINALNKVVYTALNSNKPYLKFRNDVFLLEDDEPSAIMIKTTSVVNLVAVIEILIKKFYGGIYNYVKGKIKQQNT